MNEKPKSILDGVKVEEKGFPLGGGRKVEAVLVFGDHRLNLLSGGSVTWERNDLSC